MSKLSGLLGWRRTRPGGVLPESARNAGCERFEVDVWQPSDFVLERVVPKVGVRPFPLHELLLMISAVVRVRPPLVFEWGTHVGESAWIFQETIAAFGIPSHVHSIDLPPGVDHAHESVRREVDGIVRSVPGAALLFHDAFLQSAGSGYNVGPQRAVQETVERWPDRWELLHSGLGLPGMTLLFPRRPTAGNPAG
jgi:hypothetical protein